MFGGSEDGAEMKRPETAVQAVVFPRLEASAMILPLIPWFSEQDFVFTAGLSSR